MSVITEVPVKLEKNGSTEESDLDELCKGPR